jgi:hypothetical protein
MNRLLRLFTSQPQLLLNHATGYVALVREQGARSLTLLCKLAAWLALAYASFAISAGLAGVALMLWSTTSQDHLRFSWLLLVVPCVPLVIGLWATLEARRIGPMPISVALRQQLAKDHSLFTASTP